jgi:hypothetical protein
MGRVETPYIVSDLVGGNHRVRRWMLAPAMDRKPGRLSRLTPGSSFGLDGLMVFPDGNDNE